MSNAKHTPELFRDQYGHVYVWRDKGDGTGSKQSEIIIDNRHSQATSEEKTLISAAPELLAALEAMLAAPSDLSVCSIAARKSAREQARTAIWRSA